MLCVPVPGGCPVDPVLGGGGTCGALVPGVRGGVAGPVPLSCPVPPPPLSARPNVNVAAAVIVPARAATLATLPLFLCSSPAASSNIALSCS